MSPSGTQVQNGSVRPVSVGNGVQGAKEYGLSDVQAVSGVSGTVDSSLGSDATCSEVKQTDQTVTHLTTTTTSTEAEGQRNEVHETAHPVATSYGSTNFNSGAPFDQQRYEHSPIENGAAAGALTSVAHMPIESHSLPQSPHGSMGQRILELERLHRKEMDSIIALMTGQHEEYKLSCEVQLTTYRMDIERLHRDVSASASRIAYLQNQLSSVAATVSQHDKVQIHSIITSITTSVTSITTSITTVVTRIEKWKETIAANRGEIAISSEELGQLSLDLSNASSQIVELRQRYAELSEELNTVHQDSQTTSLLHDKDHTIASLTGEIAEWKNSDAAKAGRIAAVTRDYEKLQGDFSAVSLQKVELQNRYDTQFRELASVRKELHAKGTLVEEKERTIATLTSEVDQWKQANEQLATVREAKEELQRNELQSKASLLEKERIISSLATELAQVKREDSAKAEQIATARKDVEQLRRELSSSSSQNADLQKRYEAQSKELNAIRDELHRIEILYPDGVDQAPSKPFKHTVSEHVARALEMKNKEMEELRGSLAASNSRNGEVQKLYEDASRNVNAVRDELKSSNAAKVEELAVVHKQLEQLQVDLTTSSSRIVEFQQRYEAQSIEFKSFREYIQTTFASSLGGETDGTITGIKAQSERWKIADVARTEELARARADIEQLRRRLTVSSSQIEELQTYHAEQLTILKTSTFVSEESRQFYETITTEVKDYAAVIKLTAMVEEWLRADAERAETMAAELAKRDKENEELRRHLIMLKEMYLRSSALKEIFQSETIRIQRHREEESRELRVALAERQSRLDDVERFVTTADAYADTMIIQVLQKLNAEVQKITTFMAEHMVEDFRPRTAILTKEQTSATQKVSGSIGQALAGCLGRKQRDDVALYLAIAFQAYITYYLCSLVSSWTTDKGYDDLIAKTYERLQQFEAQTISGRWRSLTRTYVSPASMSDPDALVVAVVAGLSDIVVAAGCAPSVSAATLKLSRKFGSKVSSIVAIAGQLSKMIGEVVSADFQILAVRPTQAFEQSTMEEDVDDDDKVVGAANGTLGAAGRRVLCSTQAGMTKRMQLSWGKTDTLTVIKPKVILESFLED